MLQRICRWILYKRMGWTTTITVDHPAKFIICLAPHTSNWDFIMGQLYATATGMRTNFLMKREWFFWPMGALFRKMGGIPVERSRHTSMTDYLAQAATKRDTFRLCITPEGTRSLAPEWKMGFYFIALKARIPILLYALDYERREIRCTKLIMPSGHVEEDMRTIKLYYKDVKGKRPELFTIGEVE